ncbi:hypothetical protein VULLAG_LOCUS9319 [Vulpes lagopus]
MELESWGKASSLRSRCNWRREDPEGIVQLYTNVPWLLETKEQSLRV